MNTAVRKTRQFFYRYLFDLHGLFGALGLFGSQGPVRAWFTALGKRLRLGWRAFLCSFGVLLAPEPDGTPRRYSVSRLPLCCSQARRDRADRYRRGVEAAALFELPKGVKPYSVAIPTTESDIRARREHRRSSSFARRHRGKLVFASVLLLVGIGAVAAYEAFFSNNLFISNQEEAGNITIADRLVTSTEQKEDVVYVLLLGVDNDEMLTDCIWLMCYDIKGNNVNVMQVPRDTYVGNESYSGKINGAYSKRKTVKWCDTCELSPDAGQIDGGRHALCGTVLTSKKESHVSATIRVINEHLGLPVDHYVIFNFAGFAKIVNAMGGVDVTLERGIHDGAITLDVGTHHLDGWQAVDFMRHRKSFAEGDVARVSNQRILVNSLLNKVLDMEVSEMLSLITKCVGCFQTDLSLNEIKDYALTARSLSTDRFNMFTMPGVDFWDRSTPGSQSYYLCSEAATVELINQYMLPYGLPDGTYATADTVSFPSVNTNTRRTNTTSTRDSTPVKTTTTTEYNGGNETEPTTTTTQYYEPETTTSTAAPTTTTQAPTTTTQAPTTTTTVDNGEAVG